MTKEEKLKHLEGKMKKAKEEGDEIYLDYLQRIYNNTITININTGGTLIMQSGNPGNPPRPPY